LESNNGELWGAAGHCYLMLDDLQKAYAAYQQALYYLSNPKVWLFFEFKKKRKKRERKKTNMNELKKKQKTNMN